MFATKQNVLCSGHPAHVGSDTRVEELYIRKADDGIISATSQGLDHHSVQVSDLWVSSIDIDNMRLKLFGA